MNLIVSYQGGTTGDESWFPPVFSDLWTNQSALDSKNIFRITCHTISPSQFQSSSSSSPVERFSQKPCHSSQPRHLPITVYKYSSLVLAIQVAKSGNDRIKSVVHLRSSRMLYSLVTNCTVYSGQQVQAISTSVTPSQGRMFGECDHYFVHLFCIHTKGLDQF